MKAERGAESRRKGGGRLAPLGEALAQYMDSTGLGESLERLTALDQWADAVGPRVARVTRAVEVRGDEMVVEAASSAWIAELTMIRRLILARLNSSRTGPPIGGIRFRLAGDAERLGRPANGEAK